MDAKTIIDIIMLVGIAFVAGATFLAIALWIWLLKNWQMH